MKVSSDIDSHKDQMRVASNVPTSNGDKKRQLFDDFTTKLNQLDKQYNVLDLSSEALQESLNRLKEEEAILRKALSQASCENIRTRPLLLKEHGNVNVKQAQQHKIMERLEAALFDSDDSIESDEKALKNTQMHRIEGKNEIYGTVHLRDKPTAEAKIEFDVELGNEKGINTNYSSSSSSSSDEEVDEALLLQI